MFHRRNSNVRWVGAHLLLHAVSQLVLKPTAYDTRRPGSLIS